jgi:benzylsuccinate CoA-transferase BbsE subunit
VRLLEGIRVLDVTDELGIWTSRRLADLGAEVVRLEPVNGDPLRRRPPFLRSEPGPDRSLWWAYWNAGKKSVAGDATTLKRLAPSFDALCFSGPAARYDELGAGRLAAGSGRLVVSSVTPFGLDGPFRDWDGAELVAWAAGGAAPLVGDADRAPVIPHGELGLIVAGRYALMGLLAALRAARRDGEGQLVDVSLQEALAFLTSETGLHTFLDDLIPRTRMGSHRVSGGPFGHFPALDGHIHIGAAQPAHWDALARWIHEETGEEAVLDESLRGNLSARFHTHDLVDFFTGELTRRHTRQDLFMEGQRRGVTLAPVNDIPAVLADPQLEARGFWDVLEVDGTPVRAPRGFRGRAPRLGEHTEEVMARC